MHLEQAVFCFLTRTPEEIHELRTAAWQKWVLRAHALQSREDVLFQHAHPEVQPCLRGKRSLLLEEMARAAGFPAPVLLGHLLRNGCPVFGPFPSWQAFDVKVVNATKSIKSVLQSAKWVKHAIAGKLRPNEDPEIDRLVLQKTEEEVAAGKAVGPFSREELDRDLGDFWVPAPRVGLRQGGSVRPIDDFSVYGHNGTSSSCESPSSGGVDEIAALIKTFACALESGMVARPGGVPGVEEVPICQAYVGKIEDQIVGRTLDLSKAYKNLAPAPAFKSFLVVALWHPDKRCVVYYKLRAMPFGARNSVFSFAGFGKALQLICSVLFVLPSSEFVDDYTQVGLRSDCRARVWVTKVMHLFGVASPGGSRTSLEFCSKFPALGVIFDCPPR